MDILQLAWIPYAILVFAFAMRLAAMLQSESASSAPLRTNLTWISYGSFVVSLFGMLFLTFAAGFVGAVGFFLAIMFLIFFVSAEIRFAGMRNRARQVEMLWVLALATSAMEYDAIADHS